MKKSMPFEQFRTHTQPVNLPTSRRASRRAPRSRRTRSREQAWRPAADVPVKVLGQGELSKKLTVHAHAFSATAREQIEAAGGTGQRPRVLAADAQDASSTPSGSPRSGRSWPSPRAMLPLYRLGAYIPAPGINIDAVEEISEQLHRLERPRLPEPVLGRQPAALRDLRARDHALHHGLDHPAADDGRRAVAREAAQGGRGRPAEDHAVHALPDRRRSRSASRSATSSSSGPSPAATTEVVENFTFGRVFVIVMTLTAGCVLLMWFGELITQRGIGNGISLMIFA